MVSTLTPRACRACTGPLDPFLDLGTPQLTGYLAPDDPPRPEVPLVLCACSDCKLVQLRHTTPRELLFSQYWYRSGVNEVMRAELMDVVREAVVRVGGLGRNDVVLDIGANDGTLLASYPNVAPRISRVAFEPAFNLQAGLQDHADLIFRSYFPDGCAQLLDEYQLGGRVKIITAIAMVYAIDDLTPFLTAIATLLHEDGVCIVQFQDLDQMLRRCAFDNICHEHLTYLSLRSVEALLKPYGLVVTHVDRRPINGGSLRLTIRHEGWAPHQSVLRQRIEEEGCHDWGTLEHFAWRVEESKRQIRAAIE